VRHSRKWFLRRYLRGIKLENGPSGRFGSTLTGMYCSHTSIVYKSRLSLPLPGLLLSTRKLFTLVVTLNAVGIAFAASGHFPYAEKWTGAMALGNLNCAILMRNELFGRFLYLFVNTCFAKVNKYISTFYWPLFKAKYPSFLYQWTPLWWRLGCTSVLQVHPPHSQFFQNVT
jgi:hypothetical protein